MFGQRREMWVAVSQRGVLPKPEQEFVLHSTNQLEWEQWMKETGSTALSGPCNAFISYSVQKGTAQAESGQRWDEGCGVAAKLDTAEEQNTLAASETWWWAWARLAVAELYKRLWMEDKRKGVWPGTESTGRKKHGFPNPGDRYWGSGAEPESPYQRKMCWRKRAVWLVRKMDWNSGEMAGEQKAVLGVARKGRKQGYTRGKEREMFMTGRKQVPLHWGSCKKSLQKA